MGAHEAVAVLALAAMVGTVLATRAPLAEIAVGTLAAGAALLTGAVDTAAAEHELRAMAPVVVFLVAVLVLGDAAASLGLFRALGSHLGSAARGRPDRMLGATFVGASSTTAVLSLDATVVLLTPVVTTAAEHQDLPARPHQVACARLANSASVLLPVSNLTNLLVFGATGLSFLGFAAATAPVWVVALLSEYAILRLWCRRVLRTPGHDDPAPATRIPRLPLLVVGAVLAAFAVTSPFGLDPAWVAAAGAVVLAAVALNRGVAGWRHTVLAAQLPFAWFVLCWAVVVAAVGGTSIGTAVRSAVPDDTGLGSLLVIALIATAAANLLNNLPATLLLLPVVAPLGPVALLALLVGVDIGSNLTYAGSLANLLWRRLLQRAGTPPAARDFTVLGLVTTVPLVASCTVALWAWAGAVGLGP